MNKSQKRTSPLAWILLTLVLLLLLGICSPMLRRPHGNGDHTRSVHNARIIGLALLEFEQEYGRFPDASTAAIIREKSDKPLHFAFASSNDYLYQLMAKEIVADPMCFYSRTAYTKKPGQQRDPSDKFLHPGEVGFGYIMNGKDSLTTEGNPSRASLCAPLAYDGKAVSNRLFDAEIHNSRAVILRLDGSVHAPPIVRRTKTVMVGAGKSLLDTGADTVWGTDVTPVIIPPLPAP